MKRRAAYLFWRFVNPPVMLLAGYAPWWLIIETTGRRSGLPRRLPLARGPADGDTIWLLAAHGRRALWVRNIDATPAVRVKHRGRWRDGTAAAVAMDEALLRRFNLYARAAGGVAAIDPCLVRVELG